MRGEFHGDMTRNEVQLDLDKFTDLLQQNASLKDHIRDLEEDERSNPWIKWIHFARTIDAYRIFPRIFFSTYILMFLKSVLWFMALAVPTPAQAGLIGTLTAVGAAWFSSYVNSGWKHKRVENK